MSSQSGIAVSDALGAEFPRFVGSDDVAAILTIDHEKEHVDLHARVAGNIGDVRAHLGDGADARYIVLRLDAQTFAFVLYMPDAAPLRIKMKYASSHATVFRNLGGSSTFSTTIFWTALDEVSQEGLEAHAQHEAAPAPRTEEEESLQAITHNEKLSGTRGTSVAGQSLLSIDSSVSEAASAALKKLGNGAALVLSVRDDGSETIDLDQETTVSSVAADLESREAPAFVVLKLDGKTLFSFVCPRTATIKQRMVYASTRLSFQSYLNQLGHVDATLETYQPETELKESAIREELGENQPAPAPQAAPKFSKPRPMRRTR